MIENTFSKGGGSAALSSHEFLLDSFEWSFSRVNAYAECPRMFKLQYMDCAEKEQNAFAEWGSLCHHVLEQYFRGEKLLFELTDVYETEYKTFVQHSFPPNKYKDLNESYYQAGLEYFSEFSGDYPDYEVIGVEQEIHLTFGRFHFVGYIDLILRDRRDQQFVIVDHKSKSGFKNDEELSHYLLQLYLYSQYIFETYGCYPKLLVFNMFRAGKLVKCPFVKSDFDKAVQWLITSIESIYQDQSFRDKIALEYEQKNKKLSSYKKNDYFCNYLCSVGKHCDRCGEKGGDS